MISDYFNGGVFYCYFEIIVLLMDWEFCCDMMVRFFFGLVE